MSVNYSSLCDDFYVDMYVNTRLDLPGERDTILAFFERLQKQFPAMGRFFRRSNTSYHLEEDRSTGRYRWVSLEADRVGSGIVNPATLQAAYEQDKVVLDLIPYMLSTTYLDIDSLDVTFSMDFDYSGSHDEVIAEALLNGTAFSCLWDPPYTKCVDCSPAVVVGLSEDCTLQARISIESKTGLYEANEKTRNDEEAITLSLTVRQYPPPTGRIDWAQSFEQQCHAAEQLMEEKIIGHFARPLIDTISQKGLI